MKPNKKTMHDIQGLIAKIDSFATVIFWLAYDTTAVPNWKFNFNCLSQCLNISILESLRDSSDVTLQCLDHRGKMKAVFFIFFVTPGVCGCLTK